MRVSKEKVAKNRDSILSAASRLFRRKGIDGVGVAEIAKEAGLTHGALYAHFPSKDTLAAAAFSYGFQGNMADTRAWAAGRIPSFGEYIDGILSTRMRDNLERGCPMTASCSEIGRQDQAVSRSFTDAFNEMTAMLEDSLDKKIPKAERRRLTVAAIAAQIGAVAVARAVRKTDPALSDEVLKAVRAMIVNAQAEQ